MIPIHLVSSPQCLSNGKIDSCHAHAIQAVRRLVSRNLLALKGALRLLGITALLRWQSKAHFRHYFRTSGNQVRNASPLDKCPRVPFILFERCNA